MAISTATRLKLDLAAASALLGAVIVTAVFWRRPKAAVPQPVPVVFSYPVQSEDKEEPSQEEAVDFDLQLQEDARTVKLVLSTGAFQALPHVHVAQKQLDAIASKLDEVSDLLSPHNMYWRFGRDEPMKQLLEPRSGAVERGETPLLQLAASEGAMVPVTLGHVKELHTARAVFLREPGEYLIARFLVSGTDAQKSRYREFSSGILDALQRERLMMRLEWIFHSMWEMPLTWGDGIDDTDFAAHGSAWGVSVKPAYGPRSFQFQPHFRDRVRNTLSMENAAVVKLVQRCLADVTRKPVENVEIYLDDEVTTWHLALHFPERAPFQGDPKMKRAGKHRWMWSNRSAQTRRFCFLKRRE
eukprot:g24729.t1